MRFPYLDDPDPIPDVPQRRPILFDPHALPDEDQRGDVNTFATWNDVNLHLDPISGLRQARSDIQIPGFEDQIDVLALPANLGKTVWSTLHQNVMDPEPFEPIDAVQRAIRKLQRAEKTWG